MQTELESAMVSSWKERAVATSTIQSTSTMRMWGVMVFWHCWMASKTGWVALCVVRCVFHFFSGGEGLTSSRVVK